MSDPSFEAGRWFYGNTHDDDGEIFDDYVKQNPLPPSPPSDTPVVNKSEKPPERTKIPATTYRSTAANPSCFQVAWPDPNRVELHVKVINTDSAFQPANLTVLYFSDEKQKAMTPSLSFPISNRDGDVVLRGHTGALWVNAIVDAVAIVYGVTK